MGQALPVKQVFVLRGEFDAEFIDRFAAAAREHGGAFVIVLSAEQRIDSLDENDMARHGWIRTNPDIEVTSASG